MKVISSLGQIKGQDQKVIMAIGVFDGVHLGHQALIRKVVRRARRLKGRSLVLTFSPHPYQVLYPAKKLPLITSLDYRIYLLDKMGVDYICVQPFNKRFSQMSYVDFVRSYLLGAIGSGEIYVGDDFRFGRGRKGAAVDLRGALDGDGVSVGILTDLQRGRKKISSTDIRRLIADGKLTRASRLLGRPVSVMGRVEKGAGQGKVLGYPTLNVYPQDIVLPPDGVYAAKAVIHHKVFSGMAYIGRKPSLGRGLKKPIVEINLFNFNKNLYGAHIIVEFIKRIRSDKKFASISALQRQIQRDEIKIRGFFSKTAKKITPHIT